MKKRNRKLCSLTHVNKFKTSTGIAYKLRTVENYQIGFRWLLFSLAVINRGDNACQNRLV